MTTLLKSKIHRPFVTDANPDYVGSILVDEELMGRTDIWNFEIVLVCGVTNGSRFETYAIPGERGSGVVAVQGAAARSVDNGDRVIIMAFDLTDEPIEPKMNLVDDKNNLVDSLEGAKHVQHVH